jgi:hypothetical protein
MKKWNRRLGTIFNLVIRDGIATTIQTMMVLLSDNTGPEMGIMRKNIMNIYELLRVKLNFMIPLSLCKFMWKIRKIEADGTIVVDEEKDYNISSRGNAGAAYNVMGCDNLSNAKALEAVKEAVAMNDAKSYKALLNAFKAGTAPGKGQLRQLGFATSQGPSLLDFACIFCYISSMKVKPT